MKIAFVFSGQGAQKVGMGEAFYQQSSAVRERFAAASQQVGYDVAKLCFQDAEGVLSQTEYTQVALLTTCTAIADQLNAAGVAADYAAGLSLGEYSALVYAGALSFEQAVDLLHKRGQYMSEAGIGLASKMVAVMNAERHIVEQACAQVRQSGGYVAPANYNMPGQIVIAGEQDAVTQCEQVLQETYGVKRCIPLAVSGPFHTKLLAPAGERLATHLTATAWSNPRIPVISNTTTRPFEVTTIADVLTRQISEPVYWEDCVRAMIADGVDTFIEIGPQKVLSKFIKKIDASVAVYVVSDPDSLMETVEAVTA